MRKCWFWSHFSRT